MNPQPCTSCASGKRTFIFGVKEPSNGEHLPKLKPCKVKHENIFLLLSFLGAVAHPKKDQWNFRDIQGQNLGWSWGSSRLAQGANKVTYCVTEDMEK